MSSGLLIRLRPTGPWRIGTDSGDRDRVDRIYHSDSLFSAVCSAMSQLGDLEDWLEATARSNEPAVRLSSCFPFQGDTRYVVPPRSMWPPAASSKSSLESGAVHSVEPGRVSAQRPAHFRRRLDHRCPERVPDPFFQLLRDRFELLCVPPPRSIAMVPRSCRIPLRVWNSPRPADYGWWPLSPDPRLAIAGPLLSPPRSACLADSGFGGERSRGWGRSEMPEITSGELPDLLLRSSNGKLSSGYWLLSLFHPSSDDQVDWTQGNYALHTRSGRVESEGARRCKEIDSHGGRRFCTGIGHVHCVARPPMWLPTVSPSRVPFGLRAGSATSRFL